MMMDSSDTPTPLSMPPLTMLTPLVLFAAVAPPGSRGINEYGALSMGIVGTSGLVPIGIWTRRSGEGPAGDSLEERAAALGQRLWP